MVKFFKRLFIFILVIIIIIAIPIILVYKNMEPPIMDSETRDFSTILSSSFNNYFYRDDDSKNYLLGINEEEINGIIKENFLNSVASQFGNDDYVNGVSNYVYESDYITFKGLWVNLKPNVIEFVLSVKTKFNYQTALRLGFEIKITDNSSDLSLKLTTLSLGNLPLKSLINLADWAVNQATEQSIDDLINSSLKDLGSISIKEKKGVLHLDKLLTSTGEVPEAMSFLVKFILNNNLATIEITDDEIGLGLDLNRLEDKDTPFQFKELNNEEEVKALLTSRITTVYATFLLGDSPYPEVIIDQTSLNQIIRHTLKNGSESEFLYSINLFDNFNMNILYPYVLIEEDSLKLVLRLNITDSDSKELYGFSINVETKITLEDGHLTFELEGCGISDLSLNKEEVNLVFGQFINNEMLAGLSIDLNEFTKDLNIENFKIGDLVIKDGLLKIGLPSPIEGTLLTNLRNVLLGVFDDLSHNDFDGFEVNFSNIINSTPDNLEENILNFITDFNELSVENSTIIYDELTQALEAAELDLDDFLQLLDILG